MNSETYRLCQENVTMTEIFKEYLILELIVIIDYFDK